MTRAAAASAMSRFLRLVHTLNPEAGAMVAAGLGLVRGVQSWMTF